MMAATPKKEKTEKKPTEYVVLRGEEATGPFLPMGNFAAYGQIAAKKAAAANLGEDAMQWYFVAVPASSFYPQKPVVQMTITFLSAEGTEEPEVDEEPEVEESPEAEEETEEIEEPGDETLANSDDEDDGPFEAM
jgi:hypothetical protein